MASERQIAAFVNKFTDTQIYTLCLVKKDPRHFYLQLEYGASLDFNNFWQKYFAESRQLKDAIISQLTWVVYLHYTWQNWNRGNYTFSLKCCVALLRTHETHQNYHLIIYRLSFIHKTMNCMHQNDQHRTQSIQLSDMHTVWIYKSHNQWASLMGC